MQQHHCLLCPPSVHCAALSTSSELFCCGLANSSIHVWSQLPGTTTSADHLRGSSSQPIGLQTTSSHRVLLGHYRPVYSTGFSNSGQYLLSSSEDCTVRLWDVHRKQALVCYRGHAYPVWDVAFRYDDLYMCMLSLGVARFIVFSHGYEVTVMLSSISSKREVEAPWGSHPQSKADGCFKLLLHVQRWKKEKH